MPQSKGVFGNMAKSKAQTKHKKKKKGNLVFGECSNRLQCEINKIKKIY